MNWIDCISDQRQGQNTDQADRSQYQRDFDRIIFSSAFRRLQGKTQVFPLPGNTFVHNRLTHSLEVSSVGRSLGHAVGAIISELPELTDKAREFYKFHLSSVVAAACLAHDLGNPPFGHSGEDAISHYFLTHADQKVNNKPLKDHFNAHEWGDLTHFEGNANALHLLTNKYKGKSENGMSLTYTTLASTIKYPCAVLQTDKKMKHTKKYGYFKCDENILNDIAAKTNMVSDDADSTTAQYKRHPFVYLVEAADDICYRVIDIEDAHRISLLSSDYVETLFISIIADMDQASLQKLTSTLSNLTDKNERISYLRAKVISKLVSKATNIFIDNKDDILTGRWNNTLYDEVEHSSTALLKAKEVSIKEIYNHPSVVLVESAGYHVISGMLDMFVPALLSNHPSTIQKKMKNLIPSQYEVGEGTPYQKMIRLLDYIAGMTDGYATDFYRKAKGIVIGDFVV